MEIIKESWFDYGTADATFSIVTQEFLIKDDDTRVAIGDQHRQAVTPLDKDRLDDVAPSLKNTLLALWTDDVVDAYKEQLKKDQMEDSMQIGSTT